MKDKHILLAIILTGVFIRVFFLWIQRPEFVGWFNHTYYYYVEVRGLLNDGALPYPDMPLLFYLYAYTAKIFIWLGIETNSAIVSSTRFWMCIIPSLLPIPIYFIAKSVHNNIGKSLWILIAISAFLPLTISHLPEFSQKNTLGLLLLAALLLVSKRLLVEFKIKETTIALIVFILIILTHYGTAAVAILYGFSILLYSIFTKKNLKTIGIYGGIFTGISLFTIWIIQLIDPQRFDRIAYYFTNSYSHSFLGLLFNSESDINQKAISIAVIILPIGLIMFIYRLFTESKSLLNKEDKAFWLTNIIFSYLLVLPIYDQLLFARFSLFVFLPFLISLIYMITYSIHRSWLKKGVLALISFGILMMTFGEIMGLQFHNRDKEEVYSDLMKLKKQFIFQDNDLIITKNGAEHICNWFLNTKASMITSLQLSDFDKYDHIYVLNPIQGSLNFEGLENKKATSETDKYLFMMRNIPTPDNAVKLYQSSYTQLLLLESAPSEWSFDKNGNWVSYF